jgi:hypothetical protein
LSWLQNLGLSRQARDCLSTVSVFDADFEEEPAWTLLKPAITAAVKRNKKTVTYKMLHDGILAKDIVLTLAANLALQELSSGRNHTYRGILSMTGRSYRTVFSTIVSFQALQGTISKDERDQALLNMADAIADAG